METQRQIFRDIYAAVELGDWTPAAANESSLVDYVLWPDLRAAYLRSHLKDRDDAEIIAYLARYGTLKPARELRYRYALQLAADGNHSAFIAVYVPFYQGREFADLDCLALAAKIALGQTSSIAKQAKRLWLVGKSQADECDPVFAFLRDTGELNTDWYRQRFLLARENENFALARYLARSIDEQHVAEASRWIEAQRTSQEFLSKSDPGIIDPVYKDQLVYALETLAVREPLTARKHWISIRQTFEFAKDQSVQLDRHIALWAARLSHHDARDLLDKLDDAAVNDEVLRWRIRTALRSNDWKYVTQNIDRLSADEKILEQWQYWTAVTLQKTNRSEASQQMFSTLADQRSYYGFLAADQLGRNYAFSQAGTTYDNDVIDELSELSTLIRARALYYVGLEGRGRSEWDAVMRNLKPAQISQAALLAHDWGWHSRAIATAALSGDYNDLELRYPLPHRNSFENFSSDAKIRESWAYGIARSESLFMRDIRSSAGAIGVMQLLPETGRRTARKLNYPYEGRNTLINPSSNIRLGTSYLGMMYQRFGKHAVPATAAYNAGPLRVEQWMPELGSVDARIWIENIPYNETRKYVRRVLTSDAIFHWRLTGKIRRLSSQLVDINAASESQSVSASASL